MVEPLLSSNCTHYQGEQMLQGANQQLLLFMPFILPKRVERYLVKLRRRILNAYSIYLVHKTNLCRPHALSYFICHYEKQLTEYEVV